MLCAERRDLILLLTSGALDASEEQELRAHLATGCPACAGHLAEAQAVWSQIPMGLAPISPSPAAKDLLMIKVDATAPQTDRSGNGPIPIRSATPAAPIGKTNWAPTFAYSALAAALAVVITYLAMNTLITQKDTTIAELNDLVQQREHELDGLQVDIRNANSVINMLRNPATQIVKFDRASPENEMPAARMLWDAKSSQGIFLASNLKLPAPDHCYELWLIVGDKAEKLAAGELTVDEKGNAFLHVDRKDSFTHITFAVTDEPMRPNITAPKGSGVMKVQLD